MHVSLHLFCLVPYSVPHSADWQDSVYLQLRDWKMHIDGLEYAYSTLYSAAFVGIFAVLFHRAQGAIAVMSHI